MERISIALTYTKTTIYNYKTQEIKRVIRKNKFRAIINIREPYNLRPKRK
jgi:hypothetical protein